MLPIIIWSPLEQYGTHIESLYNCPSCTTTPSQLSPIGWNNSDGGNPTLIHCVNTNAILISRIYSCPSHHRILGHNPDIINAFTRGGLCSLVPFTLWHKTGFTTILVNYIVDMCESQLSMAQIESILTDNRIRSFYNIKEKYLHISQSKDKVDFPEYNDKLLIFWTSSQTIHSIASCYLHKFWQHEQLYRNVMSMTTIDKNAVATTLSAPLPTLEYFGNKTSIG